MDEATVTTTPEQVSQAETQDKILAEWTEKASQEALKTEVKGPDAAQIQEAETNQAKAEENKAEAEAQAKPKEEVKPEEKKPEDKPEDKNPAGIMGKARRLLSEGDVKGALKLALGVDLEQVELNGKQWRAIKYHAVEREKEADQAKEQAAQEVAQAQHVVRTLDPFIKGAQAYLSGDFETFLKLTTGDSPEQFQRKLINQLHSGDQKQSDPVLRAELERIQRERAEEKAQAEAQRQQWENQAKKQRYEQEVANWKNEVSRELAGSQFAKLAQKASFVERIFQLQEQHYDRRTKETIGTLDAAEMAWDELYGDMIPVPNSTPVATTAKVDNTQRSADKNEVPTTVKHTQTNEAAPVVELPWSPENQEKILEFYARKAKSEALQASLNS